VSFFSGDPYQRPHERKFTGSYDPASRAKKREVPEYSKTGGLVPVMNRSNRKEIDIPDLL